MIAYACEIRSVGFDSLVSGSAACNRTQGRVIMASSHSPVETMSRHGR
jgi:hypothetical protein